MIILRSLDSAQWTSYLIELFSLGVTADAQRTIIGSKSAILLQRGPVDPKFYIKEVAPTNHSCSQKTRLQDLLRGAWYKKIWTDLSSVSSQCTRLTERRTDTLTPFSSLVRPGIPCSAKKRKRRRKFMGKT